MTETPNAMTAELLEALEEIDRLEEAKAMSNADFAFQIKGARLRVERLRREIRDGQGTLFHEPKPTPGPEVVKRARAAAGEA